LTAQGTGGRGHLVLHSSTPPETKAAHGHTGPGPKRNTAAACRCPDGLHRVGEGAPARASGPNDTSRACAQRVKCSLIATARSAETAQPAPHHPIGHPEAGSDAAVPVAGHLGSIASPITATSSRRLTRPSVAQSRCVFRQPRQIDRRGRTLSSLPPRRRRARHRPWAHGPSTPWHDGQASKPPTRSDSTTSGSVPTMSTGALRHRWKGPPDRSGQSSAGGPLRVKNTPHCRLPLRSRRPRPTGPVPAVSDANDPKPSLICGRSHRAGERKDRLVEKGPGSSATYSTTSLVPLSGSDRNARVGPTTR